MSTTPNVNTSAVSALVALKSAEAAKQPAKVKSQAEKDLRFVVVFNSLDDRLRLERISKATGEGLIKIASAIFNLALQDADNAITAMEAEAKAKAEAEAKAKQPAPPAPVAPATKK